MNSSHTLMKPLLILLLAALPSVVHAQAPDVEAEVRRLEGEEHQAMLRADAPRLQEIWAPNFMVNAPFNRVTMGSQEVVDLVEAGAIAYASFERDVESVLVEGDLAVTMGSETVVPTGGHPEAGETLRRRYTNVWMRQEGTWRLVARHANVVCD